MKAKILVDYLKDYGKYTFYEREFNEVDNVVLSVLSYVDFSGIVPMIDYGTITIKDASDIFYKKYTKKELDKDIISIREASYLLKEIAKTKRFKDLELLNYEKQVTFDSQFCALCIKLPHRTMYVSYMGTDNYVSSWKEDFMLAYEFPIKAQKVAIEYLNMVSGLFGPKLYVGGHSKGGNLALVASMYCHNYVYRKIKHVYSNDGPGLRLSEYDTNRFKRINYKYTHIVPGESVFGLLLKQPDNYIVIKSIKKKFFQHNALNWVVDGDHFERCKLSTFSKKMKHAFDNWIDNTNDSERKEFTEILFSILKKAGITDLKDVKANVVANMIKILKETKNISKENRKYLMEVFKDLYAGWRA